MYELYSDHYDYILDIQKLVSLRLAAFENNFDAESVELAAKCHEEIKMRASFEKSIFLPIEYIIKAFRLNNLEEHFFYTLFLYETNNEYKKSLLKLQDGGNTLSFDTLVMLAGYEYMPYYSAYSNFANNLLAFTNTGSFTLKQEIMNYIFHPDKPIDRIWMEFFSPDLYKEPLFFEQDIISALSKLVTSYIQDNRMHVISIFGSAGSGRRSLVRHTAYISGLSVMFIDCGALSRKNENDFEKALDEIRMESLLMWSFLCLCNIEHISKDSEKLSLLMYEIKRFSNFLFITTEEEGFDLFDYGFIVTDCAVPLLNHENSIKMWEKETVLYNLDYNVDFGEIANVFKLTPLQVKQAAQNSYSDTIRKGLDKISSLELNNACRKVSTKNISSLGKIIEPVFQWNDLILSSDQKEMLRNAIDRIKFRDKVYKEWGFDNKMPYGAGLHILLCGLPGTGKTMTAQVLANELGLPVYKIDLSMIMSKYIGETEKNLNKVFDESENTNSILFFDEADSLFGKRTEIKDSHDRHANLQVSFLLQKIEEHQGVVLLATNLIKNFDDAFKRRFNFIITIQMPDKVQRKSIWEKVFPDSIPVEDEIDFGYLSEKFELSGSNIKNIALTSAFYAARNNKAVGMKEIIRALKHEVVKEGRIIVLDDDIEDTLDF